MDGTAEALRVLLVTSDAATTERLRAGLPAGVGLLSAAVARAMRRTFRAADVLARLGPGELAVLFLHDGDDRAVVARFQEALAALDSPGRPWRLALRAGAAHSTPGEVSFTTLAARSAAAARTSQPWLAPRFGAKGASAAGSEDRQ